MKRSRGGPNGTGISGRKLDRGTGRRRAGRQVVAVGRRTASLARAARRTTAGARKGSRPNAPLPSVRDPGRNRRHPTARRFLFRDRLSRARTPLRQRATVQCPVGQLRRPGHPRRRRSRTVLSDACRFHPRVSATERRGGTGPSCDEARGVGGTGIEVRGHDRCGGVGRARLAAESRDRGAPARGPAGRSTERLTSVRWSIRRQTISRTRMFKRSTI